jgi:hypothetical protein
MRDLLVGHAQIPGADFAGQEREEVLDVRPGLKDRAASDAPVHCVVEGLSGVEAAAACHWATPRGSALPSRPSTAGSR